MGTLLRHQIVRKKLLRIFATYIGHFLSDSLEIVRTSLDYCNEKLRKECNLLEMSVG